jgi:hypothetical protein
MADLGEVKQVEEVIAEQTNKAAEKVSNTLENVIENAGIDSALVEPIIELVTASAATVVSEATTAVVKKLGLEMVTESSLSEDQKKLASSIYESVKKAIESFINDPDLNNTIKITKTLGQVIKQLESTKVEGNLITGADKKAVAIQLGRILIREVMPDDKGEVEVLMVYDLIAEPTLEAMIDVSKVVNVAIQEISAKCCPSLLDLFKTVKVSK